MRFITKPNYFALNGWTVSKTVTMATNHAPIPPTLALWPPPSRVCWDADFLLLFDASVDLCASCDTVPVHRPVSLRCTRWGMRMGLVHCLVDALPCQCNRLCVHPVLVEYLIVWHWFHEHIHTNTTTNFSPSPLSLSLSLSFSLLPVFNRPREKFNLSNVSASFTEGSSPLLPAGKDSRPKERERWWDERKNEWTNLFESLP